MSFNTGEASQEPEIALDEAASRRALDAIRRDALDGLLALPRVGMGVGGFLTGTRRANVVQILDHIEIPCLHALGPAFLLTPEELENGRKLAAKAEPVEVLGMYISRTRGGLEPTPADLDTFAALSPGYAKILLVIRPSTVEPVRATLFARHAGGQVSSRCDVRMDWGRDSALDPEPTPEPARAPLPAPNLALQAVKLAVPTSEPTNVVVSETAEALSPGAEKTAIPPTHEVRRDVVDLPSQPPPAPWSRRTNRPEPKSSPAPRLDTVLFRQYAAKESPRRAVLYTFGAVALIAAAAVKALDILAPKPELTLSVREENETLVFRWNRNAAAGVDRGRLLVNDAGELHEYPLDALRIDAGFFQYRKKSNRILAKLVLGDRSAHAEFFRNSPGRGTSTSTSSPIPGGTGKSRGN